MSGTSYSLRGNRRTANAGSSGGVLPGSTLRMPEAVSAHATSAASGSIAGVGKKKIAIR
jgi:hypothetical protein